MTVDKLERDLRVQWGRQIRRRRIELGLSQTALAARCLLDQAVVSKIETGRYGIRPALQLRLAVALEIAVDDLFAWPMGVTDLARHAVGAA